MNKTMSVMICALLLVGTSAIGAEKKKAAGAAPAPKRGLVEQANDNVAGQGYGMAGCGLGSILFGTKEGMIQIFAATTNGTAGSQTFGISTGTSNCDAGNKEKSASLFISVNREVLAKDISRGSGETLANFSQVIGCENADRLGVKLQQNFNEIFPNQNVAPEQASDTIRRIIQSDSELARSCNWVG